MAGSPNPAGTAALAVSTSTVTATPVAEWVTAAAVGGGCHRHLPSPLSSRRLASGPLLRTSDLAAFEPPAATKVGLAGVS